MNAIQAYQILHQAMHIDPNYTAKENHSTFLLVEMVRTDSESALELNAIVVDPEMPDRGDAAAYLELSPTQRLALELSEIVGTTAPGVSAITQHAPLDEGLWEMMRNDKVKVVMAVRTMATKAAVMGLNDELPSSMRPTDASMPSTRNEVVQ